MWEHYMIDNPPPPKPSATDEDYEKEAELVEGYDAEEAKEEGRLPMADEEHFEDPDFDAEWDAEDEEDDSDIIGENPSEKDFQSVAEGANGATEVPSDLDDEDEWGVL